jgi:hypothetical protein
MIFSIVGMSAKKLPSEIGGLGVLHDCVGFRRSPIRLGHRTLFPCIVLRLHSGTAASRMQTTPICPRSLLSISVRVRVDRGDAPALAFGCGPHLSGVCNFTHSSTSCWPTRHSTQQAGDASASGRFSKHPERPAPFANCHSHLHQKLPTWVGGGFARRSYSRWRRMRPSNESGKDFLSSGRLRNGLFRLTLRALGRA